MLSSPEKRRHFDAEAGGALSATAGAARSVRRGLKRRARLALFGLGGFILLVYLLSPGDSMPAPALTGGKGRGDGGGLGRPRKRPRPAGGAPAPDRLRPAGGARPAPAPPPNLEVDMVHEKNDTDYFVLDENGDRFLPNVVQRYAPLHPNEGDYRAPERLFSDIDEDFLKPPKKVEPFPKSKMREIVSDWSEVSDVKKKSLPKDSFAAKWTGPKAWNKPGPGTKKIQWPGFEDPDEEWETKEEAEVRANRRAAVKRSFIYAWQKYKDYAWGHDEVKPVSLEASDPFNGWGASIVDSLDTLLIMGLEDEYNLARPFVNQLNFNWIKGRDWAQGYVSPETELDKDGNQWTISRDKKTGMQVFETGIRYLGGLLGAYDLSGDKMLLDRAVDLAEILKRAFNTKSGLPQGSRMDPGFEEGVYTLYSVSIAEVGSMSLELIRLGHATGDRQWFDLAQRCTDYLDKHCAPRSKYEPLLPMRFNPDGDAEIAGTFSFGAMTDSYYEYLIKTYQLLGGGPLAEPYARLYKGSIDQAKKLLYTDIEIMPDLDLFTIGKFENGQLNHEVEHLACFAGGMLGMGARLLDRDADFWAGQKFTNTCFWLSQHMSMGIQPEVVHFFKPDDADLYINKTVTGRRYHPPMKVIVDDSNADRSKMQKDGGGTWRWKDDNSAVAEDSGRGVGLPISYYKHLNGSPPGLRKITPYYINRPETIESVFYMYRLTGDRKWQEKGWKMFAAIMEAGMAEGGISSVKDVTVPVERAEHGDNMESFIFAETFKYHYLLQSDPDLISLDDYVLNTEAHTLIANQAMKPGSSGFWTPPAKEQKLGDRGQGTDTQKWMRLKVLEPYRNRAAGVENKVGADGQQPRRAGMGMGGGGGNPNFKPQPPGVKAGVKVKEDKEDKEKKKEPPTKVQDKKDQKNDSKPRKPDPPPADEEKEDPAV